MTSERGGYDRGGYVARSLEIAAFLHAKNSAERKVLQEHILQENGKIVQRLETVQPTYRFRATSPRKDSVVYGSTSGRSVKKIYSSVPAPRFIPGMQYPVSFPYLATERRHDPRDYGPSGARTQPHPGPRAGPVDADELLGVGPDGADDYSTPVGGPYGHHGRHGHGRAHDGRLVGSIAGGPGPGGASSEDWRGEVYRLQEDLTRVMQELSDFKEMSERDRKALANRALEDELALMERDRQLERAKMAVQNAELRAQDADKKLRAAEERAKGAEEAAAHARHAAAAPVREGSAAAVALQEELDRARLQRDQASVQLQAATLQVSEAVKRIVETEKERDRAKQDAEAQAASAAELRSEVAALKEQAAGLREELANVRAAPLSAAAAAVGAPAEAAATPGGEVPREIRKQEQALEYLRAEVAEARGRLLEEQARSRGKALEVEDLTRQLEELRSKAGNPSGDAGSGDAPAAAGGSEGDAELIAKLKADLGAAEDRVAMLLGQASFLENEIQAREKQVERMKKQQAQSDKAHEALGAQIGAALDMTKAARASSTGTTADLEMLKKMESELESTRDKVASLLGQTSYLENEVDARERAMGRMKQEREEVARMNAELKEQVARLLAATQAAGGESVSAELLGKLQLELDEANDKISRLLGEASFLENEIFAKERMLQKMEKEKEAIAKEREALRAARAAAPAAPAAGAESGGGAGDAELVAKLKAELSAAEDRVSELLGQASFTENDLASKDKIMGKLRAELDKVKAELAAAKSGSEAAPAAPAAAAPAPAAPESASRLRAAEDRNAALEAQIGSLTAELGAARNKALSLEQDVRNAQDDATRIEDLMIKQQVALREAQAKVAQLQQELDAARRGGAGGAAPATPEKAPAQPQAQPQTPPVTILSPPPAPSPAAAPAPAPAPAPPADGMTTYSITLETGGPSEALQSPPQIIVQVYGQDGGMEPDIDPAVVVLGGAFSFDCSTESLGEVVAVRAWHECLPEGLTFVLKRVTILNRHTGAQSVFEVGQEVKKGEDNAVLLALEGVVDDE